MVKSRVNEREREMRVVIEEGERRGRKKKRRGEEEYIVAIGRGEYEKTKSHH